MRRDDLLTRTEQIRNEMKRVLLEEFNIDVGAPLSAANGAVATTALVTLVAEMLYRSAQDHNRLDGATRMIESQLRRAWAIWETTGKPGAMH